MSADLFGEALENPNAELQRVEDDIDVENISSDEETENGTEAKADEIEDSADAEVMKEEPQQGVAPIDMDETKPENGEAVNSEWSTSTKDGSADVVHRQSSDSSSNDSSSDDDSDTSSGDEINVMEEEAEDEEPSNQGPIKSKNELGEEAVFNLPEDFQISSNTPIHEIGSIKSSFDFNIIVQSSSSAEQRVLKENSVLCLQDRQILGPLCEVFGPLQAPFYRVAVPKSKSELFQELSKKVGQKVFYVAPEAHWHDTFELKRLRGTDASNGFDEELPEEEQEFSDDEKEAMFKKMKKQSKKRKSDVQTGDTGRSSHTAPAEYQVRSKVKSNNNLSTVDDATTTRSYKPRSTRQSEARSPEVRISHHTEVYEQQQYEQKPQPQHYQSQYQPQQPQLHHHQQQQQQQHNVPFQQVAQSPYGSQQSSNFPPQGYQYPQAYPYQTTSFTPHYNQHSSQVHTGQYAQGFPGSNYPQHHSGLAQTPYTQIQPSPNAGFAQPQMSFNPGFSQPQMSPTAGFVQPHAAPQMGSPQMGSVPQTPDMQQVMQLQQILMNQQKQHQDMQR
ncbi:LANO_0E12618g1_1 [Lachancea nothofagi CBS 11611]|uniref:H/ACA ribonucleoprotein complex non-core subunit NAF1 n=1 Tax=Lachancea nothofagi CBS 11611 TaxID=1266666 RepID=A0A1G4JY86_9SACH|nr:LANO_0E12618g1_1 [Lachancea nothofagi CBS 11611]